LRNNPVRRAEVSWNHDGTSDHRRSRAWVPVIERHRRGKEKIMRFEGIHHVTCITGDAPGNVDFYTRVLGLRMVKKTVNQDDPTVYHLFYADEAGSPGADITFFEYPGARRGRAGAGMVHTVSFRVAGEDALAFWEARLEREGIGAMRTPGRLRFADPE